MFNPRQNQPRPRYVQPNKPRFGEILNANSTIKRDLNKDLMMKTQFKSEVKTVAKRYWHR